MNDPLTQSTEDYLKAIYDLTRSGLRASTNDLAELLEVKPASVTGMLQKMAIAQPPLVDYQKHHGVALTPHGERQALEIIRHHRLLETYLYTLLGYEWDAIHEEACRMEHVISEEFEERIAQAMGDPSYDPHGDPIPDRQLVMPDSATTRLGDLEAGQTATVQRVRDSDPQMLRYLGERGVVPGARLTVLECYPFDNNLRLQLNDQAETLILGQRVARQVFVSINS
jgi:DtxR family Mn-dependent transcriptional regulator